MVGEGGEKLSKRGGGLSLEALRDDGVEPAAVISYLARIGSSQPVEPVWSLDEAAKGFAPDEPAMRTVEVEAFCS